MVLQLLNISFMNFLIKLFKSLWFAGQQAAIKDISLEYNDDYDKYRI